MNKYNTGFWIGSEYISINSKTYFIADIAANHDGCLERAKELIWKAKEAGAQCAKFQHFKADKIVSDFGFKNLDSSQLSHQKNWDKSVSETYDFYHTKREWNTALISECKNAEIEFMTTPYDIGAASELRHSLNAIKIGSGDITHFPLIDNIASMNLPMLLATGASEINEVINCVHQITSTNPNICLMQCNTNYTGSLENFNFINLNVIKTFNTIFPGMPIGLSDHSPGHTTVLGAIALGARVVEKHFTDDNSRTGPDHAFAMNPITWREMVDRSREMEAALGDGVKRVEKNEQDTVVIQRRSCRVTRNLPIGTELKLSDVEFLRPCPVGSIPPCEILGYVGRKLLVEKRQGTELRPSDFS